jgi:hypothetical protein
VEHVIKIINRFDKGVLHTKDSEHGKLILLTVIYTETDEQFHLAEYIAHSLSTDYLEYEHNGECHIFYIYNLEEQIKELEDFLK